jgi:SAM-dependent methyltransferase
MSYKVSADYYDALYADKDYASEATQLHQLIEARRPGAQTLLDVACGTGRHLEQLRTWYDVTGVDAEPRLLEIARRRLHDAPLHHGDMRDLDLGRRFDVVTCLFSSIGYMHTRAELDRAVANMARHLTPDEFVEGLIGDPIVGSGDGFKVVRMNSGRIEENLSVMEFHYLVARPRGIEHFTETHALALYPGLVYQQALESAELIAEHDEQGPMGRGLWIGQRAR